MREPTVKRCGRRKSAEPAILSKTLPNARHNSLNLLKNLLPLRGLSDKLRRLVGLQSGEYR